MPKFEVDIPHALSAEEARARISGATTKLERDYGATCTWKGDKELLVSRKGLDARLAIEPSRVHIDLNLGFLLTPLASAIKSGITKELSGILSAGSQAAPGQA
ncbi:MAG TPA: polyhydroxyalkanoic acid system family protein [Polyangia bacterium]|jgi:putative polyhydroxyalkanoate system protein|nr:polyhydroxyalkanoic acid system family protein [Polyangia bacterium]